MGERATDLGGQSVALLVVEIGDDDLGAAGGQLTGTGLTDARCATGEARSPSSRVRARASAAASRGHSPMRGVTSS